MDWFLERARELGVDRSPPKPLLLGRHLLELGMQPGPDMGALLKQIYEKQLDGEIKTTEEGIALASQILCVSTQRRKDAEILSNNFLAAWRLCVGTTAQAARSCARRNSSSSRGTLVPTECSVGDQPSARARGPRTR